MVAYNWLGPEMDDKNECRTRTDLLAASCKELAIECDCHSERGLGNNSYLRATLLRVGSLFVFSGKEISLALAAFVDSFVPLRSVRRAGQARFSGPIAPLLRRAVGNSVAGLYKRLYY